MLKENVQNIPFKLNGNTYHVKLTAGQYERMKQWLNRYDGKKMHFMAHYPTLEEAHYDNMTFIWLLGEISEMEENLKLCQENMEEVENKVKYFTEQLDKNLEL